MGDGDDKVQYKLPSFVMFHDKYVHVKFPYRAESCYRYQRTDPSNDALESGYSNRCHSPRVYWDGHRYRLNRSHLCGEERVDHKVRVAGDAWVSHH